MRPWFIGEAPSPSTTRFGSHPLVGETGHRLARWSGLSPSAFRAATRQANLFGLIQERWSNAAARAQAVEFTLRRQPGESVVLLGQRVAAAFEHRGEPFVWDEAGGVRWALVPHPSGLSHFWNDTANVRRAERFLRRLLGQPNPPRQPRLPSVLSRGRTT